jgi:cysteine desulfurase
LRGGAYAAKAKGKTHIAVSAIEHHAVKETALALEKEGFTVTWIPVNEGGRVELSDLQARLKPTTGLIAVMGANNETGIVQPIEAISALARGAGARFFTDLVQLAPHKKIDISALGADVVAISAHKFYGPKGIGALYIRKGVRPQNFMEGGAQESGRRAGTENVAGIVGMAEALRLACVDIEEKRLKFSQMRDYLIEQVLEKVPHARLNGHRTNRLPNNANFCFRFIEGEGMLILLDQAGIYGSSGSACTSGSLDPSHVLLAIGLPHEIAHGSLRLTLSEETTKEEIDYTVDKLAEIIARLRGMSPLYEDFVKKHGEGK